MRVEEGALERYAAGLPAVAEEEEPLAALAGAGREARAAFVVCLNAINFGSGWWPTIRKRPGHSGFFTVAAGVSERFRDRGPWRAAELAAIGAGEVAASGGRLSPAQIDSALWNRGREPRYKAVPRPRSRNTAY